MDGNVQNKDDCPKPPQAPQGRKNQDKKSGGFLGRQSQSLSKVHTFAQILFPHFHLNLSDAVWG